MAQPLCNTLQIHTKCTSACPAWLAECKDMFSLFTKEREPAPETVLPPAQRMRAMDLPERMAFRRELAEQAVRDALRELGVAPAQYRFRVMPLDARHHRYLVTLDVAADLAPRAAGRVLQPFEVEAWLCRHAREHYALVFEGIYWRTGQEGPALARRPAPRPVASTMPQAWELVSEEEKEALMEAIRAGTGRPMLHVGELSYSTDMAPLDGPLTEP